MKRFSQEHHVTLQHSVRAVVETTQRPRFYGEPVIGRISINQSVTAEVRTNLWTRRYRFTAGDRLYLIGEVLIVVRRRKKR